MSGRYSCLESSRRSRRDAEQTPVVGVEDRREDARRIKARAAVPVDRPVGADERDGVAPNLLQARFGLAPVNLAAIYNLTSHARPINQGRLTAELSLVNTSRTRGRRWRHRRASPGRSKATRSESPASALRACPRKTSVKSASDLRFLRVGRVGLEPTTQGL